ncbi:MAG: sigma-70 family RNA polymerase sigma factor [Planctomycetes bacterium]|nr:sigma-70 family RNA polymerase sigma factor [Planctomycetota bacterium]
MEVVTLEQPTDRLALEAGGGSRAAFAQLVRLETASVWQACSRLLRDTGEAEDAVQETFLKAWLALPRYRPEGRFRGWLARIAHRVCLDRLRARKEWTSLAREPSAPAAPLQLDDQDEIAAAVSELGPRERAVIHARYTLGLSGPEIAAELELTPGNVRVILHRAIGSLRLALKGTGTDD